MRPGLKRPEVRPAHRMEERVRDAARPLDTEKRALRIVARDATTVRGRDPVPVGRVEWRVTGDTFEDRARKTAALVSAGAPVIYEAVAGVGGVYVVADLLVRMDGGWRLIEFSTEAPAFPEPLRSVAVRFHVLRQAGIEVVSAIILHPAREPGRHSSGNPWLSTDVTADAGLLVPQVPSYLAHHCAELLEAVDSAAEEFAAGSPTLDDDYDQDGFVC